MPDTAPTRTYQCDMIGSCPQRGAETTVTATPVGPFWDWPALRCVCDAEPRLIAVDGIPFP